MVYKMKGYAPHPASLHDTLCSENDSNVSGIAW